MKGLTGYWRKNGGAYFIRKELGQQWETSVSATGYVTAAQIAVLLNVEVQTVHGWINNDLLGATAGKPRRVPIADVKRFAVERGLFVGVAK